MRKLIMDFLRSKYGLIFIIILTFSLLFNLFYWEKINREITWSLDVGTNGKWAIRDLKNSSMKTLVDTIISEYFMEEEEVTIELLSLPYSFNPARIAYGIINLRMPYNISVNLDDRKVIPEHIVPFSYLKKC